MTIGAISLQFSCVSGPEKHEKCNEIAPIAVLRTLLHKNWERSQYLCNKVRQLVQFRCIFRAFQALKRTKNATKLHQSPYFVLCYIKNGNVPNVYVTKYDDWCNFVAYFALFRPRNAQKMQRNSTNRRTLLHKYWEHSQYLGNKIRRLVQFRCLFHALQGLKSTNNATKLHQSS